MLNEEKLSQQAHKIMAEQKFMHSLDVALHWYLPKAEANDVLEDYQDIRRQASRDGEAIFQTEQDPGWLPRELRNPQEYRSWLRTFAVLLFCPLLPTLYMLRQFIGIHFQGYIATRNCNFIFIIGLALALFFSRRWKKQPGEPGRSYKPFLTAFVLLLFDVAGALGAIYLFYHVATDNDSWISGHFIVNYLAFWAGINGALCLAALVACRVHSCRWLGVYLIGLTMLLGIVYYLEIIISFDNQDAWAIPNACEQLKQYCLPLACGIAASLKTMW